MEASLNVQRYVHNTYLLLFKTEIVTIFVDNKTLST